MKRLMMTAAVLVVVVGAEPAFGQGSGPTVTATQRPFEILAGAAWEIASTTAGGVPRRFISLVCRDSRPGMWLPYENSIVRLNVKIMLRGGLDGTTAHFHSRSAGLSRNCNLRKGTDVVMWEIPPLPGGTTWAAYPNLQIVGRAYTQDNIEFTVSNGSRRHGHRSWSRGSYPGTYVATIAPPAGSRLEAELVR